jgi:hemerythrin-like domain-containing protein
MSNILQALHTDHAHFNRILHLLRENLTILKDGGRPDYPLMLDIVDYLGNYANLYHHPKEDVIFGFVLERSATAADAIAELRQQHQSLRQLTQQLYRTLESLLHDTVISKPSLISQLDEFLERQTAHLNAEEASVFPLIQRVLKPGDWQAIERLMPTRLDPLFGGPVAYPYETLYERIAEAA